MAEFKAVFERIPKENSNFNLFDKIGTKNDDTAELNDMDFEVIETHSEYLMYLTGEQAIDKDEEAKKQNKKAEIIVIVDKSGSMQGTPWRQVQSALIQMLDLTQSKNNCQAIAYNHAAEKIPLSSSRSKNKSYIESIRAGGSTNFVAVFNLLKNIFENEAKDPESSYYIFMMTDGNDTVNNKQAIANAKEHLQTSIANFGGEAIFNVLGFSEHHDDDFLESLALIGTTDGTYSFVDESEGAKALEERLVALINSTSSTIGTLTNVELIGENVDFFGDWFGEVEKEVVLPAKIKRNDEKMIISTRKFVRVKDGEEPTMTIRIHEKLRGDTKPQEAKIIAIERKELEHKNNIDAHSLKKLRSAMNLISARLADPSLRMIPEKDLEAKTAYKLVKDKMDRMNNLDKNDDDIKRLADSVKAMIIESDYIFEPSKNVTGKYVASKRKHMLSVQADYGMAQNVMSCERSSEPAEKPIRQHAAYKGSSKKLRADRSKLQQQVRQTDYSRYSDSE